MSTEKLESIQYKLNDYILELSDAISELRRLKDEFHGVAAMVDMALMDAEMEEKYRG